MGPEDFLIKNSPPFFGDKKVRSIKFRDPEAHLANGPWNKSLNFIIPTKYGIPKSLKG